MRAVICRDLTGIAGLALVNDWPEPQAVPGEVVGWLQDLVETMFGSKRAKETPQVVTVTGETLSPTG